MEELHSLIQPANSFEELFPPPSHIDEFTPCYELIDVGYTAFYADAFALGPFYIVYDEEQFGRDTWGWSAHADYIGADGCFRSVDGRFKCHLADEALSSLVEHLEGLR